MNLTGFEVLAILFWVYTGVLTVVGLWIVVNIIRVLFGKGKCCERQ